MQIPNEPLLFFQTTKIYANRDCLLSTVLAKWDKESILIALKHLLRIRLNLRQMIQLDQTRRTHLNQIQTYR